MTGCHRRIPQTPKTVQNVRDVDMSPTVCRILWAIPNEGFVFSPNGATPLGEGTWGRRQWTEPNFGRASSSPSAGMT